MELYNLRFPIGEFQKPEIISTEILLEAIETISAFPEKLKKEVEQLTNSQLDTPYRANGWTIRQVIHHCADSHMNCFIRIKWALTEENPTIKFYYENLWAENIDKTTMSIQPSLQLLEGLHYRLTFLMKNLSENELKRTYIHPEHNKEFEIQEVICLYAWHCNHHLAHIIELKKREMW